jgi:hypothetical protein
MTRFTEKTVRTDGQWVKITRDNEKRTFTFARGWVSSHQAHEIDTFSFKWFSNWSEALDYANRQIQSH